MSRREAEPALLLYVASAALVGGTLAAAVLRGFVAGLVAPGPARTPAGRPPRQWPAAPPDRAAPVARPESRPGPESSWSWVGAAAQAADRPAAPVAPPALVARPPARTGWTPTAAPAPEPRAEIETVRIAGAGGGAGRRTVQCPRCGGFRVQVRRAGSGFAFGCGQCAHRWRWAPGQGWPATVLRPGLRLPEQSRKGD
jgi:hypothetical protein